MKKKDTIFSIRCFIDGKRKKTHEFTKREAKIFLKTARFLEKYLKKEYKLD